MEAKQRMEIWDGQKYRTVLFFKKTKNKSKAIAMNINSFLLNTVIPQMIAEFLVPTSEKSAGQCPWYVYFWLGETMVLKLIII